MEIEFSEGFEKDIAKSKDKKLASIILKCIELFENANDLDDISNIKKMKGHTSAYRYRKGKYRIGFYYENSIVLFAAFLPRDKIYKKFP
ncbi:MAG TPA: hypothetical protein PKD51_19140 [Saprospiraceae bacterium]|nr:hypothetical protein [Saprospiraceae bacterium]HMU05972.1 hypothetical protein [Saprospiraceae bacterium]